tara:strand:+ start:158 stop:1129 length:972 start_codon:yes stop_codon:yes gene_type:complete
MNKYIAITIGDIKGIGIHILLRAWKQKKIKNFILITNIKYLNEFLHKNKIRIKLNTINIEEKNINYNKKRLNIFDIKCKTLEENTYISLKKAYELCFERICIGMVTLPLKKESLKKIDRKFIGQTEFFQKLDKRKYSNMILFHNKIIISTLTTHIEIKKLPKLIQNKIFLFNQINNLYNCLKSDFNIKEPKLIISGFNPHAGENGKIGDEEINYIMPVINKLKKIGVNIKGPLSADSILINKNLKKYDCYIFLFHDQALIPFKYISQFTGVNFTGNLNIIRTSPDHGTAYNLIGSKDVSSKSFINSFKLIYKIYKNRMINGRG